MPTTFYFFRDTIDACRERNIDCIVAPYEADAQLAFLYKINYINLIISEDSDLTIFGCEKILFKMDSNGNATLVDMAKLNLCLGNSANNFTLEKFRYMAIMSGCDYLDSLPNIGLGRSFKFWSKVTNLDLKQVLPKIPGYLNMNVTVTTDYINDFIKADRTFLYQLVFDPRSKTLQPLNKYENHIDASDLPFCGEIVDRGLALGLALGNVDLVTLKKVNNYDPDQHPIVEKPRYGRRSVFPSIWNNDFSLSQVKVEKSREEKSKEASQEFQKCFSIKPKNRSPVKTSTTTPLSLKRKRTISPPLVSAPSNIIDDEDISIRDVYCSPPDKEIVYKSRYFKPPPEKKSPCKLKTGDDWLGKIEESQTKDPNQLNYHPDLIKENVQKINHSELVLKQAFKPHTSALKSLNSEEFSQKRNPFAKSIKSPEKMAETEIMSTDDVQEEQPLTVFAKDLKFSPCLSDVSEPTAEVASAMYTSEYFSSSSSQPVSESSPYFSSSSNISSSQPSSLRKPKGLSGLMKPSAKKKKIDIRQPSIIDMFKK